MIPEVIDHKYRVIALIGSGGMAHVYKAVNMSTRKVVAIKMLKEEFLQDQELLRRFEREAKASLHLSHENIVRAYGVGEDENVPYIVLEYVEGKTLKELIQESGCLTVQQSIGIACQILDALSAAHSHGIIHRDVKPQNVIVNNRGHAKLADFGIAREVAASTVTFSGKNVIGSVHYISPEQASGGIATAESDIYSAGITLYEMLTGTVPYKGDTTVSTALMHLSAKPTPPKELNPQIPTALNDIVLRSISKEPGQRYSSARAMRADLIRSLTNPEGSFAREREDPNLKQPSKRPALSVYAWIAISVFAPILVIFLAYLGFANDWCAGKDSVPSSESAAITEPTTSSVTVSNVVQSPVGKTMIDLTGFRLDDALYELNALGFTNIFVATEYTDDNVRSATIIKQSIEPKAPIDPEETVTITIARENHGKFKADVSFMVDIAENDSLVQIVYRTSNTENIDYSVVLYETTRAKESIVSISATLYSNDAATRTIYLLINGEEARSQDVRFSE